MDRHDTLLIVSGSGENRAQLRRLLEKRFHLLEAGNSQQTMLLLKQNVSCIAAVLLDVSLENTRQEDLLTRQEGLEILSQTAIIAICREETPQMLLESLGYGAADVIPLDYEPQAMLHRIENVVDLHLHRQHLKTLVEDQAKALRQSNEIMVDALSSIIEYRSAESGQHILRIRQFTKLLLEDVMDSCPEYGLDDRSVAIISSAAALHDIGKIAIPDAILMKKGPLTAQEREIMNTHAETGCKILACLGDVGEPEYMRYAYHICRYHHERWDGKGYPEGLSGDAIPICAQVVGLADAYDALTTKRAYKEAFSFDQAVNMILKGECGMFSPKLLECFKHVVRPFEALARACADGKPPKVDYFDAALPAAREMEENTLERVRAKYFALLHYIDGFLIEVNFNQRLFHVVYNPYPELALFRDTKSLEEIRDMVLNRLVLPGDRQAMEAFLDREIPAFLDHDLRRMTKYFHIQSQAAPEGELFELTLLRINPMDSGRRSLAVLGRRVASRPAHQHAQSMLLSDSVCCCLNDQDFTLQHLGNGIPLLAGYTRKELQEEFGSRLIELVVPEDRQALREAFHRQLSHGLTAEAEVRVRHKNGRLLWVLNKSRLELGPDGREYLQVFLTDISSTKALCDELTDKLDRYEIILAQTENVLFEWDMESDTVSVSETWERIFGFPPANSRVETLLSEGGYFHPDDVTRLVEGIRNLQNGSSYEMAEARVASARGRYLWCRFRASAIRNENGTMEKVVGIIINIDSEKQAKQLLQDQAEQDSLTRLLNKHAGRKQAEAYLSRYAGVGGCALLIIDLDNFKQINDQYGHLFGDAVLTKVAREIEKMFRSQDILSRIGGDEFMVLMKGVTQRTLLEDRCRRLIQVFENLFPGEKSKVPFSCSIGIARCPEDGMSYPELFNRADRALYRAKAEGKHGFWFYDRQEDAFVLPQTAATRIDSDVEPGLAEDNIVRYAFQRLYTAKDVERSVNDILALIGRKMNVSRVYVFENSDDNRFCSNTYEWCNEGIAPEIENLQNISYERDIPNYEDNFNEQGIFYCPDIRVLPKAVYDIVAPQGIQSMLHCAIRDGGVFRGYIGFDECVEQRYWTKEQIQTLTYFAEMLSVFLLKMRKQEKAMHHAEEISSILDNQDAWIYIIDPETCSLQYLNTKTKQLAPEVLPGMPCYKNLMGREQRCPGCPAEHIQTHRAKRALMVNPKFDLQVLADATLIQWQGKQACLLTCRELPGQQGGTQ